MNPLNRLQQLLVRFVFLTVFVLSVFTGRLFVNTDGT